MSVCSSSSPTYLQDFEHIMNLGETQMTPCPLIPFIPQSKRTRTLYLCLYLCTKTNTHTALLFFAALMMNALTAQLIISGSFDKTDLHLYP